MPKPLVSDERFIELFTTFGPAGAAAQIGCSPRAVLARRETLQARLKIKLESPIGQGGVVKEISNYPHRAEYEITNGVVLIGSDAHIWPGQQSTAMRAFVRFCKDLRPKIVVLNGDVLDFPQISRHSPIGWESWPTVKQELEAAQDQLNDIALACSRGTHKVWTLGNHDARFEARLAIAAPEFARIHGVHLRDHFAAWKPAWSVWVNSTVAIKHRWKSGINAHRTNALNSGMTMVTGHLHKLQVTGITDYRGRRWGIDSGCLADVNHKAFVNYTEDAPLDWASGFVVLTFKNGELLPPELVQVWGKDSVVFRGEVIRV